MKNKINKLIISITVFICTGMVYAAEWESVRLFKEALPGIIAKADSAIKAAEKSPLSTPDVNALVSNLPSALTGRQEASISSNIALFVKDPDQQKILLILLARIQQLLGGTVGADQKKLHQALINFSKIFISAHPTLQKSIAKAATADNGAKDKYLLLGMKNFAEETKTALTSDLATALAIPAVQEAVDAAEKEIRAAVPSLRPDRARKVTSGLVDTAAGAKKGKKAVAKKLKKSERKKPLRTPAKHKDLNKKIERARTAIAAVHALLETAKSADSKDPGTKATYDELIQQADVSYEQAKTLLREMTGDAQEDTEAEIIAATKKVGTYAQQALDLITQEQTAGRAGAIIAESERAAQAQAKAAEEKAKAELQRKKVAALVECDQQLDKITDDIFQTIDDCANIKASKPSRYDTARIILGIVKGEGKENAFQKQTEAKAARAIINNLTDPKDSDQIEQNLEIVRAAADKVIDITNAAKAEAAKDEPDLAEKIAEETKAHAAAITRAEKALGDANVLLAKAKADEPTGADAKTAYDTLVKQGTGISEAAAGLLTKMKGVTKTGTEDHEDEIITRAGWITQRVQDALDLVTTEQAAIAAVADGRKKGAAKGKADGEKTPPQKQSPMPLTSGRPGYAQAFNDAYEIAYDKAIQEKEHVRKTKEQEAKDQAAREHEQNLTKKMLAKAKAEVEAAERKRVAQEEAAKRNEAAAATGIFTAAQAAAQDACIAAENKFPALIAAIGTAEATATKQGPTRKNLYAAQDEYAKAVGRYLQAFADNQNIIQSMVNDAIKWAVVAEAAALEITDDKGAVNGVRKNYAGKYQRLVYDEQFIPALTMLPAGFAETLLDEKTGKLKADNPGIIEGTQYIRDHGKETGNLYIRKTLTVLQKAQENAIEKLTKLIPSKEKKAPVAGTEGKSAKPDQPLSDAFGLFTEESVEAKAAREAQEKAEEKKEAEPTTFAEAQTRANTLVQELRDLIAAANEVNKYSGHIDFAKLDLADAEAITLGDDNFIPQLLKIKAKITEGKKQAQEAIDTATEKTKAESKKAAPKITPEKTGAGAAQTEEEKKVLDQQERERAAKEGVAAKASAAETQQKRVEAQQKRVEAQGNLDTGIKNINSIWKDDRMGPARLATVQGKYRNAVSDYLDTFPDKVDSAADIKAVVRMVDDAIKWAIVAAMPKVGTKDYKDMVYNEQFVPALAKLPNAYIHTHIIKTAGKNIEFIGGNKGLRDGLHYIKNFQKDKSLTDINKEAAPAIKKLLELIKERLNQP